MEAKREIWKAVPGYEGSYEVSDLGRVKSLCRVTMRNNGRKLPIREKILIPVQGHKYLMVPLRKNNKGKSWLIHTLVAMGFLEHVPNGVQEIVVDHIDNNKLNNVLSNIQLITQRENSSKDRTGGTSKYVGVSWKALNKKWVAQIHIEKKKHIGLFDSEIDASNAYQEELKQITHA